MTVHYFSGRKPASIPRLEIPGSSIKPVAGTPVNILDHYAVDYRAADTSIIDVERALFGDEIYNYSFGYDIGPQIGEDLWHQFRGWKAHTEIPQTIDVIPRAEEIGYKVSSRERIADGKFVHDSEVSVPLNKVGLYVSKAENVRQALNDYLKTEEAQLLNRFMNSKGYELMQDIDSFVVGHIPENAIAAVHRKEYFLAFNKNFRDMIARAAKAHGVEYDDEKFNTVLHELIHLYLVDSEEELENLALEFYLTIANREPEGYNPDIPKTIRSEKQKYLAKARIPLSRLVAQGKRVLVKNIESKVEELYQEAREKGLDEQETQEYVDARLEVYAKTESAEHKEAKDYSEETGDIKAEEAADGETAETADADSGETSE